MLKFTLFEKTLPPKNYVRAFFTDDVICEALKPYDIRGRWHVRGILEEDDGTYSFQCEVVGSDEDIFIEVKGLNPEDLYSNEEGFLKYMERLFKELSRNSPEDGEKKHRVGLVFV